MADWKTITELKKEGYPEYLLRKIAKAKGSPVAQIGGKRCKIYFDKDKLDKFMIDVTKTIVILLLLIILIPSRKAEAGFVKDEALGGMSKALDDFYSAGNVLFTEEDLHYLSAAMELENGCNSDRCLLLTGSVILNRAYYCKWCPDTIYEVLMQKGQYAKHTVDNLETVKVNERTRELAIRLLLFGPICPQNVVFQAMFPQGSGLYEKVDTEYFCYE